MSKQEDAAQGGEPKVTIWHKMFGSKPGDGEMQPKEGFAFSLAGFGQNLICTVIGSYLTVFMTDAIGYSALAVAFLMLFARIFDAANDPIMGSIVDRTRTKWGKCRPYLAWMPIPIAVMTIICFLPVYPNNWGGFAALAVIYVLWSVVYTVADVPYWGLSTAMSNDTYRRGNLLTIARLFCTFGAGIVTVFTPIITDNLTAEGRTLLQKLIETNAPAAEIAAQKASISHDLTWIYFIIAIVCCVVAIPLFFIGFKNTKERNQSTAEAPSLKHNLGLLFKNKPLMLIVLSGIGGAARMLFTYTGGLYFAKYVMNRESMYALFTMAVVPGGLIASLLVPYFTKKFGKRNTYIWSHVIGGVFMLIAYIVGIAVDHGNYTSIATVIVLMIALVVAGVPTGIGNIVTYAMIGDTVEYLELKTGERAEGICFAMQTFISKIGMAVGAFIGVLAYYMAGVEANNVASVTAASKDTMWTMLVLVAAISFFLTVIPLFFYKFNEKEQQEAVAEIKRRKAIANGENPDNEDLAENGYAPETFEFPNADAVAVPPAHTEETPVEEVFEEESSDDAPKDEE